jgi:hypothetical protein
VKYADFDEVANNKSLRFTPMMYETIKYMPDPGELGYYLSKNPQEASRIAGLDTRSQIKEVIKHAIQFETNKANVSKAPAPAEPLKGGAGQTTKSSGSAMSYLERREYEKTRGSSRR